jgi:hypothetical protein
MQSPLLELMRSLHNISRVQAGRARRGACTLAGTRESDQESPALQSSSDGARATRLAIVLQPSRTQTIELARGFGAPPMSCTGLLRSGDAQALSAESGSLRADIPGGDRAATHPTFSSIPPCRHSRAAQAAAAARTSARHS